MNEHVPPGILAAWQRVGPGADCVDDPGPEWVSVEQLAALWRITPKGATFRAEKEVRAGRADKSRRRTASNHWQSVYRLREGQDNG